MARTLIESVCKHILDETGITYSDKDDLPKLYKETAKQLRHAALAVNLAGSMAAFLVATWEERSRG